MPILHQKWLKLPIPLRAFIVCMAGAILLIGIPYVVSRLLWLGLTDSQLPYHKDSAFITYNASVMLLFPFFQGVIFGRRCAVANLKGSTYGMWMVVILFANVMLASLALGEGHICIIMATPLLAIMVLFGMWLGQTTAKRAKRKMLITVAPLVALFVFHNTLGPRPEFANAISDTVTVAAPPDYVWRYIINYPVNTAPPEYWLWKIGLPAPIQSTAAAPVVGAYRVCQFTDGIKFDEEITELVPNKVMTFKVTAQPDNPELMHHFSLDKGQLMLEANADGSTTIVATSWYRIFGGPAAYFNWWAADNTRQVHFRVLNHMKRLAEADYHHKI